MAVAAAMVSLCLATGCQQPDPVALARESIAKGDHKSAWIRLRAAVQAQPGSPELRVMLADMQERRHDLAGAQDSLLKALAAGADANVLVPRVALIMLDRSELDALVRSYRDVRLTDPAADSSLRGTVALALLGLQRPEPARAQLGLAAAAPPSVALARAQLLVQDGKAREALAMLDLDGADRAAPFYVLRAAKRIAVAADDPRALDYMQRAAAAVPWHGGVQGEWGEMLVTAGRFDEAAKVRQQLRREHPTLFWTHYLDALLLHREQRFEEAHAAALRALRISPDSAPAQLMAASAEVQKGDLVVADKRLEALLRQRPDSVTGWQLSAMAQGRQGRADKQAKAIQRGLDIAPGDVLLLAMRADQQLAAGQFKPAQATLKAVLAKRPDDLDSRLKMVQARYGAGDTAGALAALEAAATAEGTNPHDSARAVSMAIELGNSALARRWAEQTLARRPGDATALLSLAAAQSALNDRAGAWASTTAALDREPGHDGALLALDALARQPAERAEVLKRYRAAVDARATSPRVYRDYAALLASEQGRMPEAKRVLELGVQAIPGSVPMRDMLVEWLVRAGAHDEAVTVAQAGTSMADATPDAMALLARTYERVGQRQRAVDTWRKLAAAHPQRGDWRLRTALLDAELGRDADAIKQLRGLIEDRPSDLQPYLSLAGLQARSDLAAALDTARKLGEQPGMTGPGLMLGGDVLARAGRNDEALKRFEAAARDGTFQPALTQRIVQVLDRKGRKDAAQRELDAALRRTPDDPTLVGEAARRAQASGDAPKAVAMLARLVTKDPRNPYLLNDLAWAQLAAGSPDALTNARRAATLLPGDANVMHTLGVALSKAGQRDDAVLALRAATHLAPLAAVPRLLLAQQLVASGDKPAAMQALRGIDLEQLPPADRDSVGKLRTQLGIT